MSNSLLSPAVQDNVLDKSPNFDHLLNEIEGSDINSLGSVFRQFLNKSIFNLNLNINNKLSYCYRAIYDNHEHHKFMEKLDERIKSHDKEIEKMCNHHYQGFIDSIRELLKVRTQAQQLNVSLFTQLFTIMDV